MLTFNATRAEYELVDQIMARVRREYRDVRVRTDTLSMDLIAAHSNGNPMDFAALLAASPADFSHDVFGIHRYIDRDTGRLTQCFVPRTSANAH